MKTNSKAVNEELKNIFFTQDKKDNTNTLISITIIFLTLITIVAFNSNF